MLTIALITLAREALVPGDVVWRAGGDAGLDGVRAVHAHGVEGLVLPVAKGLQVNVGLRGRPGAGLT